MSSLKDNITKPIAGTRKDRPAPKRFLFDFPEVPLKKAESQELLNMVDLPDISEYIPLLTAFSPPKDHKKAYDSICEHISNTFNEMHRFITREYPEIIQEVSSDLEIDGPKDCLNFFKETILKFCQNFTKKTFKEGVIKEAREYEKLLQKAENKIRDLIRNEQIYRISFDQYTYRHEEAEKIINELQYKLKEKRTKIENLSQENQKLVALLQTRDEEIKSLISESQNTLSHPILMTPHSESPLTPEQQNAKLRNLNLQNLKGLLNNRDTPAENSITSPELATVKLSARVSSPLVKSKTLERGSKSRSSGTGLLTLKINTIEKPKDRDGSRNRLEILTERKRLDNSTEQKSNTTERLLDSFNFNLRPPRKATNTQLSLEKPKMKPNPRKLIRHESTQEEKSKLINSARLRPYDDSSAALFRTEASEDYECYSAALTKAERKKRDEQRQLQSKREEYQLLNSSRQRKSGTSKIRPIMTDLEGDSDDRSPKLRNIMSKQPAYGFSNQKNTSKERSPKPDTKDPKMTQNNPVFMNIMLKKLAGQKSTKKGL